MEVYVEYALLDNLCVDSLILYLTQKLCRQKTKWYLILAGAAVGTAFALLLPLFSLPPAVTLSVKFLLSVAMTLIVYNNGRQKYILLFLTFYFVTFLFGGAIIGLTYLLSGEFHLDTALFYRGVPVWLLIGVPVVTTLVVKKLFRVFARLSRSDRYSRDAVLKLGGRSICLSGFVDSGNGLTHEGKGVIVTGYRNGLKLLGCDTLEDFLRAGHNPQFRRIRIYTAAGEKTLNMLRLDSLVVRGAAGETEYEGVYLALSPEKLQVDLLLHTDYAG